MPFNNSNKYEARVHTLSISEAHKECNKYDRKKSVDVASIILSAGSAPLTGPFSFVIAGHSAWSWYKHSQKHNIVTHELMERGEEPRPRKRDKVPGVAIGLTGVVGLGVKGAAKAIGLF